MFLQTVILVSLSNGVVAQPLDTDILVSKGGDAKVVLVVDESCSMTQGSLGQLCPATGTVNSKTEQLRTALTGCVGNEGVLDLWSSRVEFAMMGFGAKSNLIRMIHDFSQDLSSLETAVLGGSGCGSSITDYTPGIRACNNTPLSRALREAGKYQQDYWTGSALSRAKSCDKHYLVLLSDGNPNGGGTTMDYACDGSVPNVSAPAGDPSVASSYLANNGDMLCSLSGEQNISTFTIGFGNPSNFDESILQNAAQGDGFYEYASDTTALTKVFDRILQAIVNKGAITFGSAAVSNSGFFSGNSVFISAFRPTESGLWPGNLKKTCIVPERLPSGQYDAGDRRCLFRYDTGTDELVTNEDALDLWGLAAGLGSDQVRLDNALIGGAGERIFTQKFAGSTPEGTVGFSDFYNRREIVTWDPGVSSDYVDVDPVTLTNAFTGVAGCTHHQLIAQLHGYDVDTFDCATLEPQHFDEWSMGAIINSGAALMAYDQDCDTAGNCTVAVGSNSGMVHFFDAATGEEYGAIVPGDLWKTGYVTPRPLSDILNQPNASYRRMPLVDGGTTLYHFDANGNAVIDGSDEAYLIFGLGHGGSGYYFLDVTNKMTVPSSTNKIFPVVRTPGNWTDDLRSTQAAPVVGLGRFPTDSDDKKFVAIVSGGDWEASDPSHPYPTFSGSYASAPNATANVPCTTLLSSGNVGLAGSQLCDAYFPLSYDAVTFPGGVSVFDAPYTVVVNNVDQVTGITFDNLALEPGDTLTIEDTSGVALLSLDHTDNGTNKTFSFLTSEKTGAGNAIFKIRMQTDGTATTPIGVNSGIQIREFEVKNRPTTVSSGHRPFLAVLDIEKINGPTSPRAFAADTQNGAELLLVTRDCSGTGVTGARCIDSSDAPELQKMVCPISAAPAVYSEGGLAKAFYFGDWCGQLWRISTDDQGQTWGATVILNVNEKFDPSNPTPGVISQNFRRIERPVDLFVTGCKGGRAIGVSFGTGNVDRAGSDDDLTGASAVTSYWEGYDVVGTIFDDGITNTVRLNQGGGATNTCGGDCLVDLTTTLAADTDASGYRGFFWALREDERMLRDVITVEGTTFYTSFQVDTTASACDAGVGTDRVYAVNNCSAEPVDASGGVGTGGTTAQDARTVVENDDSVIGAGLSVFAPPDEDTIVSTANIDPNAAGKSANLLRNQTGRGFRLLYWYQPAVD